jgi:rhodanese-related sulfurtransferase
MDTYLEFAGNHTLLVGALVFSFFLLVFTELRRKAAGLINVDPPEAVRLINADATVIDLRSVEAFTQGHIVHAKNIPFDELQANAERIDKLKSKSIIAVCDSGAVSTKAVDFLRKHGIESVYGLKGGMNAWTQASMPVVTAKKTKTKKEKKKKS